MNKSINTENANDAVGCTVYMDGKATHSEDFVAVLSRENGDASIMFNTDALTLGMSLKLISKAFVECMQGCTDEDRDEITAILGDAFIINAEDPAND